MHPIKFVHCADIHLGAALSYLSASGAQRSAELLMTFEKILCTARDQKADLLLIAGDLFDSNRIDGQLIGRAFEMLSDIAPIKVVITAGNHDPLTADSPYITQKLPDNVHVFGGEDSFIAFDDINTRVYGRSFTEVYMKGGERFSLTPPQDNFNNILLLHGDTAGDASSQYNGITAEMIRSSGMDYIALGHIHKRSEPQMLGKTVYAYSGCPEGLGFDETGEKGVYLGTVQNGECSLEFLPLCRRQHIEKTVELTGCCSQSEIISRTLEAVRAEKEYCDQLYKVVLTGELNEELNVPAAELLSRLSAEVFFVKLRDKTRVKLDLELAAKENSLKGIFISKMLEKRRAAQPHELPLINSALDIGLRAFYSEVKYRDDQ